MVSAFPPAPEATAEELLNYITTLYKNKRLWQTIIVT